MARLLSWMPEGWVEKEPSVAVSFTTVAESFDSNPPPGRYVVTARSYTDSSVEEDSQATEVSLEIVATEDGVDVHLALYDPWKLLANQEERQQTSRRGKRTVRWAVHEKGADIDWASFPRLTAPRSCGGATKSVRFMDPVVGEIFEKPKAEKRGRVKSAAKGVWKNLKKKLICGAKLDFGAPMAVQSPVTKGCRKRGHQYKA